MCLEAAESGEKLLGELLDGSISLDWRFLSEKGGVCRWNVFQWIDFFSFGAGE